MDVFHVWIVCYTPARRCTPASCVDPFLLYTIRHAGVSIARICFHDDSPQSAAYIFEPPHDKTNKMTVRPAMTQTSLGIRPVWSESSLSAWRKIWSLATQWAHSKDSDQTGQMARLIWVFVGRSGILLVLSWGGSFAILSVIRDSYIYNIFLRAIFRTRENVYFLLY